MPTHQHGDDVIRPRPFWSGVVTFGLVSLPVSLFPAVRGGGIRLFMVDEDGTRLKRTYFDLEDRPLDPDDIIRGYEIQKDTFIPVEDEELEALSPEKSREIDLKRFVPIEEIDPVYFERAYFLVPDSGTTKAYRLLAKSMEQEQRAGIATFVMRGKEYLCAIVAEAGILRAETLRFHNEIRTPEMVGLPGKVEPAKKDVDQLVKAMRSLKGSKLDRNLLKDREAERLSALIKKKLSSGKNVLPPEESDQADDEEEPTVIDLMEVLKKRLEGKKSNEKSVAGKSK